MRCFQARKRISAQLDGELDPRRQASLEGHLQRCPRCKAVAESLRKSEQALARLEPPPPLPPDLRDRLIEDLDRARRARRDARRRAVLLRAACVAACILAGFAAGVLLPRPGGFSGDASGRPGALPEAAYVAEAFDATAFGFAEAWD